MNNLYKIKVGENVYSLGITNIVSEVSPGLMSSDHLRDLSNVKTTIGTKEDNPSRDSIYGKLNELSYLILLNSNNVVSLERELVPTVGYAATYKFYQGGIEIGKIDIPLDFLVKSGAIVDIEKQTIIDPDTKEELDIYYETATSYIIPENLVTEPGKYIKFVVNAETVVDQLMYIKVSDLVNIYRASTEDSSVKISISDENVISAEISDKSIGKDKLSDSLKNEIESATSAIGDNDSGIIKKLAELENKIDNNISFIVNEDESMLEIIIGNTKQDETTDETTNESESES